MQTYIVRVNDPSVRDTLGQKFEKVGKPRSLHKSIIVETEKSKSEIEKVDGVIKVEEDVEINFDEKTTETKNWALPRISGQEKTSDDGEHGDYAYIRTGKNVDIYIADTGIKLDHEEFLDDDGNSRVISVYAPDDLDYTDESDHGTAVASQAGGNTLGVARDCNLFNVRCLGQGSSVIKGLDKVLEHHKSKDNNNTSVLNMSFSANSDTLLKDETKDLVEEGVICVAAAGNDDKEDDTTPSCHSHVISVGATDRKDNSMTGFSNYGKNIDLLAPGFSVYCASVKDVTGEDYTYHSGTSFSSPLTAGVCGLISENSVISNEDDVNKVKDILIENTKSDIVPDDGIKGETPNRFLYSLIDNDPINSEKFKLTTEVEGEGSVDISETEVQKGEKVSIEVKPKDGHKLKKIKGEGTMSDNKFTTDPIKEDTKLVFVFEPAKYKVTVEVEGEGTVEPKEVEVEHGEKVEFKYEPKDGYKLKEVKNG